MDKSVLEELLATMVRSGASSLHLIPGRPPFVRVQGKLVMSKQEPVALSDLEELTRDFLFADHRACLKATGEVEILYASRSGDRFRTKITRQSDGLGILLRRVPNRAMSLEELDLPPLLGSFTQLQSGIVVVAGFFGSGKSTTLAAMVDRLNQESLCHIVTVEDPIEFIHPPGVSLLHQREVGAHVTSIRVGIKQAVRLGADVIAVGEMHSHQELDAALTAAEQGCLVLTTVDASSVVAACTEIISMCPLQERARTRTRLATHLRALVSQTLLLRSHQQGGRVPLLEILINNAAVRAAVRAGSFHELPAIMKKCRGLGMQTTDAGLRSLLNRHLITQDEALYHATDRESLMIRGSAPVPSGTA